MIKSLQNSVTLAAATLMLAVLMPAVAFAEEAAGSAASVYMPLGVGLVMGLAVLGGGMGQGKAISAGLEAIGRNPSVSGDIQTRMIVGLVFIESLVIFAFAVCYLLMN